VGERQDNWEVVRKRWRTWWCIRLCRDNWPILSFLSGQCIVQVIHLSLSLNGRVVPASLQEILHQAWSGTTLWLRAPSIHPSQYFDSTRQSTSGTHGARLSTLWRQAKAMGYSQNLQQRQIFQVAAYVLWEGGYYRTGGTRCREGRFYPGCNGCGMFLCCNPAVFIEKSDTKSRWLVVLSRAPV